MPRISLRLMLFLVAIVALAVVSLRFASAWWEVTILCFMFVVFCAVMIVALVGRGPRQAFAIGMAVVMAGYAVVKLHEPQPTTILNALPSTSLLLRFQTAIGQIRYFDSKTTKEIPGYDPAKAQTAAGTIAGGSVYTDKVPLLKFFLPIGHCWWALFLGYVGGLFARFVYQQRMPKDVARP